MQLMMMFQFCFQFSDGVLREDTNDGHLDVLALQVLLVALVNEEERQEGEQHVEHVAELAALLPGRDTGWERISLFAEVVNTAMQPVAIAIDMEFLEVTELIQGMVLEVVSDNLVLFLRLRFILEPILGHDSR